MTFTVFGYTGYWYGLIFGLGVLAYLGWLACWGFTNGCRRALYGCLG